MAAAEGRSSPQAAREKPSREKSWHEVVLQTLKRNDIRLVPYVPDRVLTTLIKNIHADPFFTCFPTAREEEAVGIVSGAWMGGMKGAVLMQTVRLRDARQRAGVAGDPLSDSADHVRVRTRHAR